MPTDVSDGAPVEALRDAALERFGAIHVACNNAGVATGGKIWEQTARRLASGCSASTSGASSTACAPSCR